MPLKVDVIICGQLAVQIRVGKVHIGVGDPFHDVHAVCVEPKAAVLGGQVVQHRRPFHHQLPCVWRDGVYLARVTNKPVSHQLMAMLHGTASAADPAHSQACHSSRHS